MTSSAPDMFSKVIVDDYDLLKLICPLSIEMSRLVGITAKEQQQAVNIVELGTGTGITTLALLTSHEKARITTIDNQATMHDKARRNLQTWQQRLTFICNDALSALQNLESNSVDIIASAYTVHNFLHDYREQVMQEIFRVLKPNGQFINGDRYALDDIDEHTRLTQQDMRHFFKVLIAEQKLDLLEEWIIHTFNDEAENRIMRETIALEQLKNAGFIDIKLSHRLDVNALVTATKPIGNDHV